MREEHIQKFREACMVVVRAIYTADDLEVDEIYKTEELGLLLDALEDGVLAQATLKQINSEEE